MSHSESRSPAQDEAKTFTNIFLHIAVGRPVLPCQSLKESVQVYRDHCRMAKEFHQVKTEIALLEDR
ncbi:MAP3K7 C-terminal-like protein, partial [Clarias magur]